MHEAHPLLQKLFQFLAVSHVHHPSARHSNGGKDIPMTRFALPVVLLALGACTDGSTTIGNNGQVGDTDGNPHGTGDTVEVTLKVTELGAQVDCDSLAFDYVSDRNDFSYEEHDVLDEASPGETLALKDEWPYFIAAGSLESPTADGLPTHQDGNGLWVAAPIVVTYFASTDTVEAYHKDSPVDSNGDGEYEPTVYEVVDGNVTIESSLNLYFDLGGATCHIERGEYSEDFEHDDLFVERGYRADLEGDYDLKIVGNQLAYETEDTNKRITSSEIDQEGARIAYEVNDGTEVECR